MSRDGYDAALFEPMAEVEPRSFWYRARNRLLVSTLRRRFAGFESLLEVGCGGGFVLAAIREAFPAARLVGGELYGEALEIARGRGLPDVELLELDARDLPYEHEFDVVCAFDVIEHIEDDTLVLRQMHRATRPGGGIVVTVPQHPWLWDDFDRLVEHKRRYTRRELAAKVSGAGFEVVELTSFVTTLLPAMVASRFTRRLLRRPYNLMREHDPGPFSRLFERILDGERRLIERGISLPFGGSLLVVARKPS